MYYSLKNIINGGTYYCRRCEFFRKGTTPHKTYTGVSYSEDDGFEIIGIHETESQAIKNTINQL